MNAYEKIEKSLTPDEVTGTKIYITGETFTNDLPLANLNGTGFTGDQINTCVTNGSCGDVFIARFNQLGQLIWSTYYGNEYREFGSVAHLDLNENLYIGGVRNSATNLLPMTGASNYLTGNGLLLRFNDLNELVWANAWEGNSISGITTDIYSNCYIAGSTSSTAMQILNYGSYPHTGQYSGGTSDGFLASFSNIGQLTHSLYFGGSCNESINEIDIDDLGNIYGAGYEINSSGCNGGLPLIGNSFARPNTQNEIGNNYFLFKLSPFQFQNAINIEHLSYFGGKEIETTNGSYSSKRIKLSTRNDGVIAIAGTTNSSSANLPKIQMPITQPTNYYVQTDKNNTNNELDAFIAFFDADFQLKYTTYFGGKFGEGATALNFSENNKRLYFCGNTKTLNNINVTNEPDKLFTERYDNDLNTNDYFLDQSNNAFSATWLAFFNTLDFNSTGMSVIENGSTNSFKIYPNPTSNKIYINSIDKIESVSIYDMQGKILSKQIDLKFNNEIDFSIYATGQYLIVIKAKNEIATLKIMKL